MKKALKIFIAAVLVFILIFAAGLALKNLFLHQIRKKVQAYLSYSKIRLSVFPLSLVLDDVHSLSQSPFFSAKRVAVKVTYRSLLSKDKPLQVVAIEPVVRINALPSAEKKGGEGSKAPFPLPFDIEKGVIKGGELRYQGRNEEFVSKDINAQFTQRKGILSLRVETGDNLISFGSPKKELQGKLSLAVESKGDEITVKKLRISGTDFSVNAEGNILNLTDPEINLETSLNVETPFIARVFDLPFDWKGRAEGEGKLRRSEKKISFSSTISSRDLVLNGITLGRVWGNVEVKEGSGGTVEFNLQKGSLAQEYIRIQFNDKKLEGVGRGFHVYPVIKFTGIPWPIKSPVWGTFTVENGELNAEIEFRETNFGVVSDKFPLSGRARFHWDGKDGISFSSQGLQSTFALVGVEGNMVINKSLDINIQGDVFDVKQTRYFTAMILAKDFEIPEIRGEGRAKLRIFGDFNNPQLKADFSLLKAGIDEFQTQSVEGEIELKEDVFAGRFAVDDPSLKAEVTLNVRRDDLRLSVDVEHGKVEEILPGFNIQFPLYGETSGRFEVRQKAKGLRVEAVFSSPQMMLANQTVSDVKGRLVWEEGVLSLSELELQFYGGKLRGEVKAGLQSKEFRLGVRGEALNLASLYPPLKGSIAFDLKGEGVFGRDTVSGTFGIKDFSRVPLQKTDVKGEIKLGFVENSILLDLKGNFLPGENEFSASLNIPLDKNLISADVKGAFRNLELLIPLPGAKGEIQYRGEVKGTRTSPQFKGVVDFKGTVIPIPRFPQAITDYQGLLFIDQNSLSLRSFKAALGGGYVMGSGEIGLGRKGVEDIQVKIEGKNLLLSPMEKTKLLADGNLRLIKDRTRFVLEGDLLIQKLYWLREFTERITFSSSPQYQSRPEPGIFNDLKLHIRVKADDNAWVENSMGKIEGKFDLTISGSVQHPILTGDVEVLEGSLLFQDRKFTVLKGKVSFTNPVATEPYVDFKAETYVKDYRVTFSLKGPLERLNPEFSSSPPLPPEDVLALLAMGEAFKRTYSYDKSTQFSTASLLSFQLAEEAKKRAEKLFRIDRFRIDPFVMGSSAETRARLTVGKKISKNFFLVYSTNLSTEREDLFRVEWELSTDLSLVGIRDEKGRLSFDVKLHRRF